MIGPFMSVGYKAISQTMKRVSDLWSVDIPDTWRQGRTVYGGLTTALALEACYKDFENLSPLRSVTVNFVGPVSANPQYKTTLLRQGRNVTMIEVKGYIEEQVIISVTFSFGTSRQSEVSQNYAAPEAKQPKLCDAFTPPFMKDFVPQFFHNFDTRLIEGARPVSGADKGYIRTWSRHKDKASREGLSTLLCLADVLPPAAMPLLKTMGPVSSMTWIVNFLTDIPMTTDGWWHVESNLTAGQNGYASQVMRIWNSEGELVVEGLQSVTLFV